MCVTYVKYSMHSYSVQVIELQTEKIFVYFIFKYFLYSRLKFFNFSDDGPSLPTRMTDEFRPFIRRLPEFKFW